MCRFTSVVKLPLVLKLHKVIKNTFYFQTYFQKIVILILIGCKVLSFCNV